MPTDERTVRLTVTHAFSSAGPTRYYGEAGRLGGRYDPLGFLDLDLPSGTVIEVAVKVLEMGTPKENPFQKGQFA